MNSDLFELLRELVAVLYGLWAAAPTGALQWRAAQAFDLAAPLVSDGEMIDLLSGDLAELRLRLAQLYTVLHWDARGRRWWPALARGLSSLLVDLEGELRLSRERAVA